MHLEFIVNPKEFRRALKQVLVARGPERALQAVDFDARADELEIVSTGSSTAIAATVAAMGLARIPLPIVKKLEAGLGKFPKDGLRIRIMAGELSIESFTFRHNEIEVRTQERRQADVPVNAALVDILAAAERFSAEELEKGGLVGQVLAAQAEAGRLIDSAAATLAPFGVSREMVQGLVRPCIQEHARRQAAGA